MARRLPAGRRGAPRPVRRRFAESRRGRSTRASARAATDSLEIDRRAEDAVFAELEQLAADGASFVAISEERGEVAFGDPATPNRVVIDPIDGSLNARRTIPSHSLSIAVASGESMADVDLGFVHDFGADEEFWAERGRGAELDGSPIPRPRAGLRPRGRRARVEQARVDGARARGPRPARRTGCGRSARSRSRSPTSPPGASTACSARDPVGRSTSPPPS